MIRKFFATRISVVLFILWILCFHRFSFVSSVFVPFSDLRILVIIFFFFLLYFIEKDNNCLYDTTVLKKRVDKFFLSILLLAIINCFVCYYYRGQDIFETLQRWSLIFLLYFYYPFRLMILKIKDWESVLYYLFIILLVVETIMMIFPELLLFDMTSGNEKFERENRIRIYGDGALVLGNIFCFNKALIEKKNIYWFLYVFSFLCIFLSGFRMVIAACLLIDIYMLLKLRMLKIKYGIIGVAIIGAMSFVPAVQERVNEIIERNEAATYDNDKYVRIVSFAYYYNEYFKSHYELFFGSGMVQRIVKKSSTEMGDDSEYKSKYSKDVSYMSIQHHFYPVDWGLIGLSWEAGIPVVLIIYGLTFYLVFKKTPKQYYYISAWALLQLLISFNNPLMYHFHNMIFYAIVLVIFEKVVYLEKNKIQVQKC